MGKALKKTVLEPDSRRHAGAIRACFPHEVVAMPWRRMVFLAQTQGLELLRGEELKTETEAVQEEKIAEFEPGELEGIPRHERVEIPKTELSNRKNFEEVELGFTEEMAVLEAKRCLNCGICSECGECDRVCEKDAIDHGLKDETEDPAGPPAGTQRVVRGGAWDCNPMRCRSSMRHAVAPRTRAKNVGFRVVVET